jgi:hypothetical protein
VTRLLRTKRGPAFARDSIQLPAVRTRATIEAYDKKRYSYKPLPKEFCSGEFIYRRIAREHDGAIYAQTWNNPLNRSGCYEVIRIRRRDGFHIGGRFVEPAEVYPNAEAWGADGFTIQRKDDAFAKLRQIAFCSATGGQMRRRDL